VAGRNSSPIYKWPIRETKPNKRLVKTLATSSNWEEHPSPLLTEKAFPPLSMKWATREAGSDYTQVRVLLDQSEEFDIPSPPEHVDEGGMGLNINTGKTTSQTTRPERNVGDEGNSDSATPPKVQGFSLLLQAALPSAGGCAAASAGGRGIRPLWLVDLKLTPKVATSLHRRMEGH
jgi:hypothetical protein